jgi:Ca2+-binding EF-hand superfamily protein
MAQSTVAFAFARLLRIGGERGYLTIDNIKDIYSTSKHPAVQAGKMTKEEALQEFLNSFEGTEGNRDGKVTLDEWVRHYEEVSVSIDSDDYFGTMMSTTWSHLKQKLPDGSKASRSCAAARASRDIRQYGCGNPRCAGPCPEIHATCGRGLARKATSQIHLCSATQFTPGCRTHLCSLPVTSPSTAAADEKTPPNTNTKRTAELAFKALDTDGSGGVNLDEFIKALERFGMHVCAPAFSRCHEPHYAVAVMLVVPRAQVAGIRQGLGGLPRDTVQALFNKYDADGSGVPLFVSSTASRRCSRQVVLAQERFRTRSLRKRCSPTKTRRRRRRRSSRKV